jgi:adenine deaminase
MFHGYVAGGAADDHEGTQLADAIARVRQGMAAMLRLGSAWYDVASQVKAITELGLDSRKFILCTDDCHAGTIVHDGHMNRVVRHAISQGLKPMTAIQMATINTATHFGLERELGSIAPGRRADLVLTSDLVELPIEAVIAGGMLLAERGRLLTDWPAYGYPDAARRTMNIGTLPKAEDFEITAPIRSGRCKVKVIGVVENQAPTRALECEIDVDEGKVVLPTADTSDSDIAHIALVERHRASGAVQNGLVSGFGYNTRCAVASTVAHDSHHLIVVGTDTASMERAVAHLNEIGGGAVVVRDGEVIADIALPIAGLMSDQPAEVVATQASKLIDAMKACGCDLNNAFMQHSLLALVVIPELRLSDIGLVDVRRFETTSLFV